MKTMINRNDIDTRMFYDLDDLSNTQLNNLSHAVDSARKAKAKTNNHFFHGACAVSHGRILSTGYNHSRSKIRNRKVCSVHAEVDVLSKVMRGTHQPYIENIDPFISDDSSDSSDSSRSQSSVPRFVNIIHLRFFLLLTFVLTQELQENIIVYYNAKSNRKLRKRKKQHKIDIYVVRINAEGGLTESEPCNECLNAMKFSGIRYVFYSTHDGRICRERVRDMTFTYLSKSQQKTLVTGIKTWRF